MENSIVLDHLGLQFFREHNRLHQIGHAQSRARCFIAVGRSNPTFGSPNFGMALAQFALFIEQAVVREDQMGTVADEQIPADRDP